MTHGGGSRRQHALGHLLTSIHALDEVSALVLDIGTSTTRAGYAGEDAPRTVFSTTYGYIPKEGAQDPITGVSSTDAQLFLGDKIHTWRAGMQASNPMRDGISSWSRLITEP